jgi:hypothetical protein
MMGIPKQEFSGVFIGENAHYLLSLSYTCRENALTLDGLQKERPHSVSAGAAFWMDRTNYSR